MATLGRRTEPPVRATLTMRPVIVCRPERLLAALEQSLPMQAQPKNSPMAWHSADRRPLRSLLTAQAPGPRVQAANATMAASSRPAARDVDAAI